MNDPPFRIRRLGAADAERFRAIRLEALERHPEAFSASHEEEAAEPLGAIVERIEAGAVFGGFAGSDLVGIAGLYVPQRSKLRHKGVLWGLYVQERVRGRGIGRALIERVLRHAQDQVEAVMLTVVADNEPAYRLYSRMGFRPYGREPRALRVGTEHFDEILMILDLRSAGPEAP